MKCNLVLEGGGVKGLAHIGALKAIEDYNLKIDGVSGTSAGALAATLFAAGYSPKEMYDPKSETGIFPENLLSILLSKKTDKFRVTLYLITLVVYLAAVSSILLDLIFSIEVSKPSTLTYIIIATLSIALMIVYLVKKSIIKASIQSLVISFSLIILSPLILISTPFFWHFGILSTRGIRAWMIETLKKSPKLKKSKKDIEKLTLGDFVKITGVDIKIIATDLTNRKLIAFSGTNENTKSVLLIDSVISSMCIPFLFRCCDINFNGKVSRFVDGGMLSNFPAWVHRKYVLLDDLKHTIGIRLNNNKSYKKQGIIDTPISYFKALVNTALWGSSSIENISVKGLMNIEINTGDVTTLKFRLKSSERKFLYESAYMQAISALEDDYSIFPKRDAEIWLKEITEEIYRKIFLEDMDNKDDIILRSSLAAFIDTELKLSKLIHTYNMDADIDRHLEFDKGEGVTGLCLDTGYPITYFVKGKKTYCLSNQTLSHQQKKMLALGGNRRALVNPKVDLIVSVPVYDYRELKRISAAEPVDMIAFKNLIQLNFEKIQEHKLTPKACLNVDFSGLMLCSEDTEKNNVFLGVLQSDGYEIMQKILAAIASSKISMLTEFRGDYE